MKTTLIAATLNEIKAVQAVLPRIRRDWVDELIIVDGGSTDGTIEYCISHGYQVHKHNGSGYGSAMQEAVTIASGNIIIEFPPDGNSLPEKIPDLSAEMRKSHDLVIVSRYKGSAKSYDDDMLTAFGNKLFTFTANTLFNASFTDLLVGFRAYKKKAYETLAFDAKGCGYPAQVAIRFKTAGFRIGEIPGDEPKRIGGKRKMSIFGTGMEILLIIAREYWRYRKLKRNGI